MKQIKIRQIKCFVLGIAIAAIPISGCASPAKELLSQLAQKRGDAKQGVTAEEKQTETAQENSPDAFSGGFDQFIREELVPRLGMSTNSSFSYGSEYYASYEDWWNQGLSASLENGIVGTFLRDLDKDGKDELLVTYIEGARQSSDGTNRFVLNVYGESGGRITEWGAIRFDTCFSGLRNETYLFGLKDVGNQRLIYAGDTSLVTIFADGQTPRIRLYQLRDQSLREIFQVTISGSDDSWMPQWANELRSYGFSLPDPNGWWNVCDLSGEPGFEVLSYGESRIEDYGTVRYRYGNSDYEHPWLDRVRIAGGVYGPDSLIVTQKNQSYAAPPALSYSGYPADEYILPYSNSMYLSRADLAGFSQEQLRLARNEIYARHGRKFKTKSIQDYFNSQSWYVGTIEPDNFRDSYLNDYEKKNVKLIQSMEETNQTYATNNISSGYPADGYILPYSSSMYLSRSDLAGLNQEQLRLARNEIYARHGRKFKTKSIQDYFNSKSWYVGTIESDDFRDSYLNAYEKENVKLIQSMEEMDQAYVSFDYPDGDLNVEYILPYSNSMYLSRADLAGLSQEQLRLARNEIYARHGRKFKTKSIQDYFNSQFWYVGTIESDDFRDSYLNAYEKANVKLIQSMEK